jgi:anti-sigma-K factor RskA
VNEQLEDQAALFVFGLLEDREKAGFEQRLEADPALRRLVDSLDETAARWAHRAPPRALPPQLRERVLGKVGGNGKANSPRRAAWIPWLVAAAFALMVCYLVAERTGLRHRIRHLQQRDLFAQIQIAALAAKSAGVGNANATVVWDERKPRGLLKATELPANDPEHDYQLWLFDPRYQSPVSGGVFHVTKEEPLRISFRPATPVRQAARFVITLEPKGGVSKRQGPIMLEGK